MVIIISSSCSRVVVVVVAAALVVVVESSFYLSICLFVCMFVCFFVLLQWISLTLSSGLMRCVAFDPRAVELLLYRRTTYEALGAIFHISYVFSHKIDNFNGVKLLSGIPLPFVGIFRIFSAQKCCQNWTFYSLSLKVKWDIPHFVAFLLKWIIHRETTTVEIL